MSRPRLHIALLATLALLVIAPAAPAATPPVGESHGVRAYRVDGAIVVHFTRRAAQLYRRIAGKRITITCTELPEDRDAVGLVSTGSGSQTFRASKRRRPFRTGDVTPGTDYCRVWLAARTVRRGGERRRLGRRLIASASLTQEGAVYLDEQEKAIALFGLLLWAGEQGDGKAYPTPAVLLQAIDDADGTAGRAIVALASPRDTPPAGRLGYYSDGALHAAMVILSASGRRLFLEVAADAVLYTNVAGYSGGFD